ncbi:MAG: arginine--tRNA ligase, partial [Ruthenibacterium sp.]
MYDFKNYNPKQAAMDETRALLMRGVKNAMANGTLPEKELPDFVVEIPNDNKNGDIASNIAMAGARVFGMAPRKIAQAIVDALPSLQDSMFTKVEIAGPGFLNLFFSD